MKLEKIIAVRTSKTVFRDGDKCIKLFDQDHSKAKILSEAATHAKVEESGLNVPKVLEVTKTEGKWAIVYEFISGKTLDRLAGEAPEKADEYMECFVEAQLKINAAKAHSLEKLKDRLAESLFAADLPSATLYELHMRLESLPVGDRICHGDFAPSNLIVNGEDEDYIVDWSHAAQGVPAADAARTYLLFWLAGEIDGADRYLSLYCEKSGIAKAEIQKWIPLRAAERLAQGKTEEREFLLYWVNVVDYE
ncbi:MAG: phosphotransferase [Cloacibacillus porcorum]|nr:phosphotransferase [Cloacibacillus porcorum]